MRPENSIKMLVTKCRHDFKTNQDYNSMEKKYNIILIGPLCSGKTRIANYISKQNQICTTDVDIKKQTYVIAKGYDSNVALQIKVDEGWQSYFDYGKKYFSVNNLKTILDETTCEIIQIGGDLTNFDDYNNFENCKSVLSIYPNVILLLPSEDDEINKTILAERLKKRNINEKPENIQQQLNYNETLILSDQIRSLANNIVITENKSDEEIADEVIKIYNNSVKKL